MPIYQYRAVDSGGKQRAGTVDARSKPSAITLLKKQDLFIVEISEQQESIIDRAFSIRGVPDSLIVTVTRQLATMISSGLPISRGLEVLGSQIENKNLKKVLLSVLRDIEGGASLATSLSKFPKVFSPTYIALVRAGEESGKLEEILRRLADNLEAQREFRSNFKSAMIYPAIVFIAMLGVFFLMMIMVIPQLADMYESLDVDLPAITRVMISGSDFMLKYWYLFILFLGAAFMGIRSFATSEQGKEILAKVFAKLPVFGKLLIKKDLTEFSRTLSLLISSGISITDGLEIVAEVVVNPGLKKGSMRAKQVVEKGGAISDYLKQDDAFPPLIGQMVSVGEETGKFDEVLDKVGSYFANETEHAIKGLSSALEPFILILLGTMVGLLIVSIITPIYKITSSL